MTLNSMSLKSGKHCSNPSCACTGHCNATKWRVAGRHHSRASCAGNRHCFKLTPTADQRRSVLPRLAMILLQSPILFASRRRRNLRSAEPRAFRAADGRMPYPVIRRPSGHLTADRCTARTVAPCARWTSTCPIPRLPISRGRAVERPRLACRAGGSLRPRWGHALLQCNGRCVRLGRHHKRVGTPALSHV